MRYLCCYACVGRTAQCGRGRATAKESEYEVSRRRTQDWWLCCLERSVYSAPLGWASLSAFVAFVFHFCSPHRSTPHTSHRRLLCIVHFRWHTTYELIVHIIRMSYKRCRLLKFKFNVALEKEEEGEWLDRKRNEQKSQQCLLSMIGKKRANSKPSTVSNSIIRAKVNKKFIIFTLTIAAQGQLTLKFIFNENVTVKNETEME